MVVQQLDIYDLGGVGVEDCDAATATQGRFHTEAPDKAHSPIGHLPSHTVK